MSSTTVTVSHVLPPLLLFLQLLGFSAAFSTLWDTSDYGLRSLDVTLDADDCATLLTFPAVSKAMGLRSCAGSIRCQAFSRFLKCSVTEKVLRLYLDSLKITGTLPAQWAKLTGLEELRLSNNFITGTLPSQWGEMKKLFSVDLSNNKIRGTLPPAWRRFSELDLSDNSITGTLPSEWAASTTRLNLSRNAITGPLPVEWTAMENIRRLDLSFNNISGTFPAQWSRMQSLEELNISSNQLQGSLPRQWAALTSLRRLELSSNNLSSTLPAAWSTWSKARMLNVSSNMISGALPDTWANMTTMQAMDLSSNAISGNLPRSWANMTWLDTMDLSDNAFEGSIPELWLLTDGFRTLNLSQNPNLQGVFAPPNKWFQTTHRWGFGPIRRWFLQGTAIKVSPLDDNVCSAKSRSQIIGSGGADMVSRFCDQNSNLRAMVSTGVLSAFALVLVIIIIFRLVRARATTSAHGLVAMAPACLKPLVAWAAEVYALYFSIILVLVDVASDIWVIYQVAPRNSTDSAWPLYTLLAGLFIPDIISTVTAWAQWNAATMQQYRQKHSSDYSKAQNAIWWITSFPIFIISLHLGLLAHVFSTALKRLHIYDHSKVKVDQSRGQMQPTTIMRVIDALRYESMFSFIMAVTEDPLSIGVTTVFYLKNKQGVGQPLSTLPYLLSVVMGMFHILVEVWKVVPPLKEHGWREVKRMFTLRRDVEETGGNESTNGQPADGQLQPGKDVEGWKGAPRGQLSTGEHANQATRWAVHGEKDVESGCREELPGGERSVGTDGKRHDVQLTDDERNRGFIFG